MGWLPCWLRVHKHLPSYPVLFLPIMVTVGSSGIHMSTRPLGLEPLTLEAYLGHIHTSLGTHKAAVLS